MNSVSAADEIVQIIIPLNSKPGETIHVQLLDGRTFAIVIPHNTKPGDPLNIIVPTIQTATVTTSTVTTIPPSKPIRNINDATLVTSSNNITIPADTQISVPDTQMSEAKKSLGAAGGIILILF